MNDYRELHELYHFGTDGMKWGRRRYQNEDGSYKPGAEGRYYDEVGNTNMSRRERKNRDILNSASEKARRFEKYANENANKFGRNRRTKVEHEASKKQIEQYRQLSKRYSDALKDPKNADRQTLREAKKFARKGTFEDADYTTFYDPKTGKKSSYLNADSKKESSPDRVKHFISSHKKEIAIGAAATTALIAGVVLYKSGALKKAASSNKPDISDMARLTKRPDNPGGGGGAAKVVTDTIKKAPTNAPEFKVTPNNTKAAVEAAKKAAQTAPRANTQTIKKGAEDLARATKNQQDEAQKIINAVDSGSDYVNQLLKENEEMLKKIRNGGA